MTADAPAGSHWKALQQQMQGPRKKRSTRSLHTKAEAASTSATDALPWFAEDLAPGDLALAMSEAPSTATAEAMSPPAGPPMPSHSTSSSGPA